MKADTFGSRPRRVSDTLVVTVPREVAAAAAAVLAGLTGRAAEIREVAGGGAPRRVRLAVDLGPAEGADALVALLVERLGLLEREHPGADFDCEREEHLVEEDRGAVRQESFHPFLAAPGLIVVPAWEAHAPRPGETVIAIDPGLAFGSGVHASTRLALMLMEASRGGGAPPRRVLDVGTGTGILALAAAARGAGEVVALDSDPDAVAAARANAARNGLAARVRVGGWRLAEVAGRFDLVVANITVDVLVALAPALAPRVAPAGALVLSGLLAGGQEAEARAVFEPLGFDCRETRAEGEWVALLLGAPRDGLPAGGR